MKEKPSLLDSLFDSLLDSQTEIHKFKLELNFFNLSSLITSLSENKSSKLIVNSFVVNAKAFFESPVISYK